MSEGEADKRREAFRQFMEARELKAAPWAERAGISSGTIYNFLNGLSDSLGSRTLEKLARAEGVPVGALFGENSIQFSDKSLSRMPQSGHVSVVGYLQAGEWRESVRWHEDEMYGVPVYDDRYNLEDLEGYEIRGDSMNLIYPEGTVVICRRFDPMSNFPPIGKNVLVQRRDKTGLYEATVKTLEVDDYDNASLVPASTNKSHEPIPYAPNGDGDGDIEITGVVVGSYRKE